MKYERDIKTRFPNGISPNKLHEKINKSQDITKELLGITIDNGKCNIEFKEDFGLEKPTDTTYFLLPIHISLL